MPLATKNGAIIVKDGKLAENCGCCGGDCAYVVWGNSAPSGGTCNTPVFAGTVRVTIPEKYEIPAGGLQISLSQSGFDDKGFINGQASLGGCITNTTPSCITITNRTIVFDVYDTAGGNVGMAACICVTGRKATSFPSTSFGGNSGPAGSVTAGGWTVEYPAYKVVGPWANLIRFCGSDPGDGCNYCGCNAQIPTNIGLAFVGASITLSSGSGTVSQKASEIEDFIEQISPTLTLQGSPSQSDASFTYSALGCSDASASGCVSCPPDFRAVEGGGAGGDVASTLGLVIPCSGAIAAKNWGFSTGQWRIEKPGSIFANYPCGQVRHLISMSFSTSPGSANMCSSPPASLSWVVSISVRSSDFGTNGVPEANYTGTANVTATFNYPNPLP